jgi:hypothetical protein
MRKILLLSLALSFFYQAKAAEGMWLPYLIGQLNHTQMQKMGLELSAEEIYSINNGSLKDAIVNFNGGCTASLISEKGLLLTNHHCGYSQIQSHSSLEKNYLQDGFWAMSQKEELTNPGVTASLVKYLKDVTNQVLKGITEDLDPSAKQKIMEVNVQKLYESTPNPNNYELEVKPFFFGNQYVLIAKEKFKDVRLVGAPPSSIGKFGADTDNWMWPRHTGDFSLFRIYASADNKPAQISDSNVPYRPLRHLKVNIGGLKNNDFTMVYGFPGTTQQYLPAAEVKNIAEIYNPQRIAIRDEILAVLDAKMRTDEATRIKYASKYARISNSWKRWKGEIKGINRTQAIAKIRNEERAFAGQRIRREELKPYENTLAKLVVLYEQRIPINQQRYAFLEAGYYGQEMLRHLRRYSALVALADTAKEDELKAYAAKLAKGLPGFYKNFDPELEQKIVEAVLPIYLESLADDNLPKIIAQLKAMDEDKRKDFIVKMFRKNPVLDADWTNLLKEKPKKAAKKIAKSDAYQLTQAMLKHYFEFLNPAVSKINTQIEKLQAQYVEGLQIAFPNKSFYPDANSTMRLSYGKIKPYAPKDGVTYYAQTYLEGVMEKYVPGDYEFDLPQRLIDLYKIKDYGIYADNGKMPVCFVATNHTTGGNSGSPVLNARGELIGLNFDRAWDGVMSDMYFDTAICRNVMVDLRYVLFIIDRFAGANYLVEEMDLVKTRPGSARKEKTESIKEADRAEAN